MDSWSASQGADLYMVIFLVVSNYSNNGPITSIVSIPSGSRVLQFACVLWEPGPIHRKGQRGARLPPKELEAPVRDLFAYSVHFYF
jgi:hypothetical protein